MAEEPLDNLEEGLFSFLSETRLFGYIITFAKQLKSRAEFFSLATQVFNLGNTWQDHEL